MNARARKGFVCRADLYGMGLCTRQFLIRTDRAPHDRSLMSHRRMPLHDTLKTTRMYLELIHILPPGQILII